ncbi:MAG: PQQ-binding-like beta-propeller repeat protein [Candidatus Neomarinimicrobiota bacterium]
MAHGVKFDRLKIFFFANQYKKGGIIKKAIYLRTGLLILLYLCLMVGCDLTEPPADEDDTTDEYDPTRFAGFWLGMTSQDLPVSFRVTGAGVIDSLVARISMSAGYGTWCRADFLSSMTAAIEKDSFAARIRYPGGDVSTVLSGAFSSDSTAHGEYDGFSGSFSFFCGGNLIMGSGSLFSTGTWEANKGIIIVNITSPPADSIVSGTIDIKTNIMSINGIKKVEFYIDDSLTYTDISTPYSYSWDTNQYDNGSYTIKVVGYDKAGHTANDQLTVIVDNKLSISITYPYDGADVSGNIDITTDVDAPNPISKVEFYINENLIYTDTSSPYSYSWDTKQYDNGTYTIEVIVYDTADQTANDENTVAVINAKWEFLTGGAVESSPAIGSDGTIYVGSFDDKLYAVNPDGTKKWEFLTGGNVSSSPAIGADGTIYVGSIDDKLYAVNPDGTKKWEFLTGGNVSSSPAVGSDGTIYVGSIDYKLYAVNPDGTKKWEFLTGDYVYSSPAIGSDGTVYIGSNDGILYAINPDGTKKWEFFTGVRVLSSSPAIGIDGTIYVGSLHGILYAINPNGTEKWGFYTGSYISQSSPAIGSDGTIYVGFRSYYTSGNGSIRAINPDGTKQWEFLTGRHVYSSPTIGLDGTIYVGSWDKKLYAITGSGYLTDSPWPMFHHDQQHTGRQK